MIQQVCDGPEVSCGCRAPGGADVVGLRPYGAYRALMPHAPQRSAGLVIAFACGARFHLTVCGFRTCCDAMPSIESVAASSVLK